MIRSYRYRLYPTDNQAHALGEMLAAYRELWNAALEERREAWQRARAQTEAFLEALDQEGAFAGAQADESYFVICDERLNGPPQTLQACIRLLFGFAALRPGEFHACLVTHQAGRSSARPVSVNRLATSGRRVGEEIETALLRGIVGSGQDCAP